MTPCFHSNIKFVLLKTEKITGVWDVMPCTQYARIRDFRLPPRLSRDLRSSGLLRSIECPRRAQIFVL
jgi:hypothetical protein